MKCWLINLSRNQKRCLMLLFDLLAVWFCLFFALTLRYGSFSWLNVYSSRALFMLTVITPLCALPFFIRMRLYRSVLRYINSTAFLTILRACAFSSITFVVVDALILVSVALPRSVPFIYFTALSIMMLGSRYFIQKWLIGHKLTDSLQGLVQSPVSGFYGKGLKALIYGDKSNVADLIRNLDRSSEYHPVAIISLDDRAHGGEIGGRNVFSEQSVDKAISDYKPQIVLLAMPLLSHAERLTIIHTLEEKKLPIKTVPDWESILSGRHRIQDLREINILDILWRDEVSPNQQLLEKQVTHKAVMITGAGGSIGAEIARQVVQLKPSQLILVDHSEYQLYTIEREIHQLETLQGLKITIKACLLSVLDEKKMVDLFAAFPVQTVFHAAAYKHVPMVEENIQSGIENNTFATLVAAQCAMAASVENFVLISTDKAVRPTSVMGASKRLAEMVLQALAAESTIQPLCIGKQNVSALPPRIINNTQFSMVRFGNVLGSSGSVIPLFKQQLKEGGPLTVTDPEVTRYFMSIPEAAQLVIQSAAMASSGDLFVLDMGSPIKIKDLATRMIELSGLSARREKNPQGDIAITYTGLRPGEKIFEELLIENNVTETLHKKIGKVREPYLPWTILGGALLTLNHDLSDDNIKSTLFDLLDSAVSAQQDVIEKTTQSVA